MAANNAQLTEDKMVSLLKAGDARSFGELYDLYSGAIYSIIRKIIESEELAQDVLQDSFVKIWERRSAYDSSKGRIFTWMLNVARNTSIDALRNKHVKVASKIQNIEDNVSKINRQNSSSQSEDTIGMTEIIGSLTPEQRVIIELTYFQGFTQEEVSKELNIPLGTVKTRTRSALIQLRQTYKKGIS